MHGFKRYLRISVALACGVTALTGSALAAPPGSPPGQEKKAEQAQAPAPAPAAAPAENAPPGQAKKAEQAPAPAPAAKPAPAKSKPAKGVNATTEGTKPSSTTNSTKPTHTTVGASPDVSKRYGNGQTAAQIAKSRGAPGSTELFGPGNSQPHKVCRNGHWVDVHAVKSYSDNTCAGMSAAVLQPTPTVTVSCPATTTLLTTGVAHKTGSGKIVVIHPSANSAHLSKHGDALVTVQVTLATGATCSATVPATTTSSATQTSQQIAAAVQQATGSTVVSTSVTPQSAQTAQSAPGATAAGTSTPAGGVLGAQHTAGTGATGGVAGAFKTLGAVAGGTLPFTGFPLWAAVVIGLAALVIGSMLWRRSRGPMTTDAV